MPLAGRIQYRVGQRIGQPELDALAQQTVSNFATTAERDAAFPAGSRAEPGQLCFVRATRTIQEWSGSAWVDISGGTGTGSVTVTTLVDNNFYDFTAIADSGDRLTLTPASWPAFADSDLLTVSVGSAPVDSVLNAGAVTTITFQGRDLKNFTPGQFTFSDGGPTLAAVGDENYAQGNALYDWVSASGTSADDSITARRSISIIIARGRYLTTGNDDRIVIGMLRTGSYADNQDPRPLRIVHYQFNSASSAHSEPSFVHARVPWIARATRDGTTPIGGGTRRFLEGTTYNLRLNDRSPEQASDFERADWGGLLASGRAQLDLTLVHSDGTRTAVDLGLLPEFTVGSAPRLHWRAATQGLTVGTSVLPGADVEVVMTFGRHASASRDVGVPTGVNVKIDALETGVTGNPALGLADITLTATGWTPGVGSGIVVPDPAAPWAEAGDTSKLPADKLPYQTSTWAREGDTSRVPASKLPTSHVTAPATWAREGDASALPPTKIPPLDASKITSGTFSTQRIPNLPPQVIPFLPASRIDSGSFDAARIPNLDASKITSGVLNRDRLPAIPDEAATWAQAGDTALIPVSKLPSRNVQGRFVAHADITIPTSGAITGRTWVMAAGAHADVERSSADFPGGATVLYIRNTRTAVTYARLGYLIRIRFGPSSYVSEQVYTLGMTRVRMSVRGQWPQPGGGGVHEAAAYFDLDAFAGEGDGVYTGLQIDTAVRSRGSGWQSANFRVDVHAIEL